MIALGVVLAVLAAAGNSTATLLEWTASASGPHWLRSRRVIAGLALDLVGWLLALGALRYLPLFAVQSVVTGQVVLTVLIGGRVSGRPARRSDVTASFAMVVGLAVMVVGAGDAQTTRISLTAVPALLAVAVGAVGLGMLSRHRAWLVPTLVAGICFSVAVVVARAVHPRLRLTDGVAAVASVPEVWVVLILGGAGSALYLCALARGGPGAILAVLSITETVLPGAAGVLLLGDGVRPGWVVPCVVAFTATVAATAVLASSPVQRSARAPGRFAGKG